MKRKYKKFMFWLNGYLFHTDKVIQGLYKPERKPYEPVNKWAEVLNKPNIPEVGDDSPLLYLFAIFATFYVIFNVAISIL
jgi:hypothetical protein